MATAKKNTRPKVKSATRKPPKKKQGDPPPDPLPLSCCADVCANTGAGKVLLVVCDGTTMKTLSGTADGQYPAWDNTAQKWVLANV